MFDSIYQFLQNLGYPHPIHPTEVHLPIGTVIAAIFLGYIAWIFRRPKLARCARTCVLIALVSLLPTILFGFMDWQHFYSGAWLFPIKVKLISAAALLILLTAAVILGYKRGAEAKAVLALYTLSFCVVVVLGYYGGNLVYGARTTEAATEFRLGKKIFTSNCSACHPGGGNTFVPKMALKTSPHLENFDSFQAYIRNPRMPDGSKGIMPPFPEAKISDKMANELYQYIVNSLLKSQKRP